jgi:hypothetical protein
MRREGTQPVCSAGWPLNHPRMGFHWYYDIIIGRRATLSEADIERETSFRQSHNIEIMTYDRLLKACAKYDDESANL